MAIFIICELPLIAGSQHHRHWDWKNCSRIASVYKKKLHTRNNLPTQSNSCVFLQLVALLGTGGLYLKNPLSYFQSECIEKVSVESSGTNGMPISHSHPKTQSHQGRESGKPDSGECHNVSRGMTGTLNSWAHSSCGCLHEACRRWRQSAVRHGKGQGHESSPLTEELLAVEGFREKESIFSKSVTGRSKKERKMTWS